MSDNINFLIIRETISGNVHIKQHAQFNDIRADKVIIAENVTARLYGTIKMSLILKKGSRLLLHGTITGKIENEGGEITIYK
jgi:hypothetical protein